VSPETATTQQAHDYSEEKAGDMRLPGHQGFLTGE
jgi:hypothetical protein